MKKGKGREGKKTEGPGSLEEEGCFTRQNGAGLALSKILKFPKLNPLMSTGNYIATSNNMKLVHSPARPGPSSLYQM